MTIRLLGFLVVLCSASARGQVVVLHRNDLPACARFGVEEFKQALRQTGMQVEAGRSKNQSEKDKTVIYVESLTQEALYRERNQYQKRVPDRAESFAIEPLPGGKILIIGRDEVGTMYGAFEAAERVVRGGISGLAKEVLQQPFLELRAVNQFLFQDALEDPSSWFFREDFWEGYFSLLAKSRHNAGYDLIDTTFPNIFPYFVYLEAFPQRSIGRAPVERNIAMLNRVIAIGKLHGVNVTLMNYTVQCRKGEDKRTWFVGMETQRVGEYTRLACRKLLESCPDLWVYGFRIGKSGQPEDFFKNTYLAALKESGFRGKLYARSWLATKENIEAITQDFKGDFFLEVKYNGEQLGLPYQAITSPWIDDPSYSYEAYTDYPRKYKLLYQVRANGTHRIFHWGDPTFIARVVKSCRLGDAAGFSVEPMTAYYPMVDQYHPENGHHYFHWTWQRDWLWYVSWGRLAYNPDLDKQVFVNMFKERFGDRGGESLYRLLTLSSKVVPFVLSYACLGPDHRQFAPEF